MSESSFTRLRRARDELEEDVDDAWEPTPPGVGFPSIGSSASGSRVVLAEAEVVEADLSGDMASRASRIAWAVPQEIGVLPKV